MRHSVYFESVVQPADFRMALNELGLHQTEAAKLLSVSDRTLRRWTEETAEIPGPAEQALRAWLGLHRRGMPWRPDTNSRSAADPMQVALFRQHAVALYALLQRVDRRGGPAAPWDVDLKNHRATLGPITVFFHTLEGGGFSPSGYRRGDRQLDEERDRAILEDAYACIARAFAEQTTVCFNLYVSLHNGNVLLWDVQQVPTVAAMITCGEIRRIVGAKASVITDEQCRLLVEANKSLFADLAATLVCHGRYTVRHDGITVLDIRSADLDRLAERFSSAVLDVVPILL